MNCAQCGDCYSTHDFSPKSHPLTTRPRPLPNMNRVPCIMTMPLCIAGKDAKTARRRRKRHEMASRAADEELAEITLEQQVLKEMSAKSQKQQQHNSDKEPSKTEPEPVPVHAPVPAPVHVPVHAPVHAPVPAYVMVPAPLPSSLKPGTSKQAMSLSIADMISALEEVSRFI